jgi:hypothetical protein
MSRSYYPIYGAAFDDLCNERIASVSVTAAVVAGSGANDCDDPGCPVLGRFGA